MPIAPEVIAHTTRWMSLLRSSWHEETPLAIHSHDLDRSGSPAWSPEFTAWIAGSHRNSDQRYRLTRAMRKLRKLSPREYEVAYRMVVLNEPIERTTAWLNDRAIRNSKMERYEIADTRAIIVSAVDKILAYL